jgi:hypothetical protein
VLKITRVSVSINVDAVEVVGTLVTPTRYEQTDSRLFYTGTWPTGTGSTTSYSGGSFRYSSSIGASVTIPFKGTSIAWIAKKSSGMGRATVSIDGGAPTSVNLYSSSTIFKQKVWSKNGLANSLHTLKITRTSGTVNIDAVDVVGTLASPTRYQEIDTRLRYFSPAGATPWTRLPFALASAGYYKRCGSNHANVTIRFNGTKLDWIAVLSPTFKGPSYPDQAEVFLDGVSKGLITMYSATAQSKKVWTTGFLKPGTHTVVIQHYSGYATVDAVDIIGSILAAT